MSEWLEGDVARMVASTGAIRVGDEVILRRVEGGKSSHPVPERDVGLVFVVTETEYFSSEGTIRVEARDGSGWMAVYDEEIDAWRRPQHSSGGGNG